MNAPVRITRGASVADAPWSFDTSPACQAAVVAFGDHARRWTQARRVTLNKLGSDEQPCRDVRGPDFREELRKAL